MPKNASLWFYARYHLSNAFIRSKLCTGQSRGLRKRTQVLIQKNAIDLTFFYRYLACLGWRLRLTVRGLISKTTGVTLTPSTIESKMKKIEINSRCESWTNGVRGGRLFMQIFLASKNIFPYLEIIVLAIKDSFQGC